MIRQYENDLKKEPYMRLSGKKYELLMEGFRNSQELLKVLKEEFNFETFLEMKKNWLKKMRLEWLIMGHITEPEALALVEQSESLIKFKPIEKTDLYMTRLVSLPERSVSEYDEVNEDPSNPNSAAVAIFQSPSLKDYDSEAVHSVVFHLLKEPFFNKLRTQEQLGYIVQASTLSVRRVLHG